MGSRCSIAWLEAPRKEPPIYLPISPVYLPYVSAISPLYLDRRARGAAEEQLEPLAANTARLARRVARDDGEARLLARRRLPPGSGLTLTLALSLTVTLTLTLTLTLTPTLTLTLTLTLTPASVACRSPSPVAVHCAAQLATTLGPALA